MAGFAGGQRFRLLEPLGAGAMGAVYRVRDEERGRECALKVLRRVDAGGLLRFKQEFRALADVVHPNLVALHELFASGDQWFFTMELVDGVDFLRYVRGAPGADAQATLTGDGTAVTLRAAPAAGRASGTGAAKAPVDADGQARLRAALRGVVDGVSALHRAGHLHRDLKPSNVLVRPDGRVTILDFGLVTALAKQGTDEATAHLVGTPGYMAPEQAAGAPLSEASDWYAVGVMIYEALTGARPFAGEIDDVLHRKQHLDPTPPRELAPDAPEDLAQLCVELLARDPARRPGATAILRRLGARPPTRPPALGDDADDLIGRAREVEALRAAAARARAGAQTTVLVHGGAGMGKSALLRHVLDELRDGGALVLAGRCYERESVPYKALDSVIDELAQRLSRLSPEEQWRLVPDDVPALARLFPALRAIDVVSTREALAPRVDPRETRRQAFGALRTLLTTLAARTPVVIAIDDVQWGDRDAAILLDDVLRPPGAPPVLLVLASRGEAGPFLGALLAGHTPDATIAVDRLDPAGARALAAAVLPDAPSHVDGVARESAGIPFFVHALARHVRTRRAAPLDEISLDDVVRGDVAALPADARRLLEVIALAGRPIPQGAAVDAAALAGDPTIALGYLRAARLVHTAGARDDDPIEAAHDRIREGVTAGLSPASIATIHGALGRALEARGAGDPEELAEHFDAAGDRDRAAAHTERAAEAAAAALAFDRAVGLYQRALELAPPARRDDPSLWGRLGDALALAGRPADAAEAYLRAAALGEGVPALDLRRRAAEKLLHSGRIDAGLAELGHVLAAVGVPMPAPRRALLAIVWNRLRLRLRGLAARPRPDAEIDPLARLRLDACWSASIGLAMLDALRAADFQNRHLLDALAAGDRRHLVRALSGEASYLSLEGPRGAARARAILERCHALAVEGADPIDLAYAHAGAGMVAFMTGRYREARAALERAEALFVEHGAGITWALSSVRLWRLWSMFFLGDLGDVSRDVFAGVRDAEQRGDRYTLAALATGLPNIAWLAIDRPDLARVRATHAMDEWQTRGEFHFPHYWQTIALTTVDLYEGKGEQALARVLDAWPIFERAMMFRILPIKLHMTTFRARAAIAAVAEGTPRQGAHVVEARRWARRVTRFTHPGVRPYGVLVESQLAELDGDRAAAIERAAAAAEGFARDELRVYELAARRWHAELRGAGDDAIAAVDEALRARGVAAPATMARMIVPTLRRERLGAGA